MIDSMKLTHMRVFHSVLQRGAHLFGLHAVVRDFCRYITERALRKKEGDAPTGDGDAAQLQRRRRFQRRLAAKYAIDALTYPILLASTRSVILHEDSRSTWQLMRSWCSEEGAFALFNGVAASLLSTALDEVM